MALVIHILTVLMLVFAMVMLYRVTYVIVISLGILALDCLLNYSATPPAVKPKTD